MTEKTNKPEYCSQAAFRYAEVLWSLGLADEVIEETKQIFAETPEISSVLMNPVIPRKEKHALTDRIFAEEIRSFLKVVTDHDKTEILDEIFRAYEERKQKDAGILTASLRYVIPPSEEQKKKMETFLCNRFHASRVEWDLAEDKSLIGGFILQACAEEYDYSVRGRLNRLEQKLTWR